MKTFFVVIDQVRNTRANISYQFPRLKNCFKKPRFLGFLKTHKNSKVQNLGFLKIFGEIIMQIVFNFVP